MTRTASQIAETLNAYEASHTDPTESNIWNDCISKMPEYDAAATADEDTDASSDVVVLKDGGAVRWHADLRLWIAEA